MKNAAVRAGVAVERGGVGGGEPHGEGLRSALPSGGQRTLWYWPCSWISVLLGEVGALALVLVLALALALAQLVPGAAGGSAAAAAAASMG